MAEQMKSPTFEEVAVLKEGLDPAADDGQPKPDMPVTIQSPAYGDPGHVNPALNPAPLWQAPPERKIVPVQNDPGVLGSSPSLADMNRAARADDMERGGGGRVKIDLKHQGGERPDLDDTGGVTEESNQEEIRQAAEARMAKLAEKQKEAAKGVVHGKPAVTAGSTGAPAEKKPEEAHPRHRRHSP